MVASVTPAARPTAAASPVTLLCEVTSLRIETEPAESTKPSNSVVTEPPVVALGAMMPAPKTSPPASDSPSASAGENDWLWTVTAPVALMCVPPATFVTSTGESVSLSTPPVAPPMSPTFASVRTPYTGVTVWLL